MLVNLHVKNFALIDEAEVEFKEGLNILTGETGAGKSIIIGSINLALGGKVSKEMIRSNEEYGLVELIFYISNESQIERLREMDIELEDNQLIITRKITNTRSISKINGETVTASILKQVAEIVIDIHGQHEHQSLLKKQKHLEILDEFAKEKLSGPKAEMTELYRQYVKLINELESMDVDESTRERELSFLQYEIDEISNAKLFIGEDEELESEYRKRTNAKKIIEHMNTVYQMTGGESSAAESMISAAVRELSGVLSYDTQLEDFYKQLLEIEGLLSDFNREAASYLSDMEFNPESFYQMEERLNCINHLKSKYGKSIELILDELAKKEKQYEEMQNFEEILALKKQQLKSLEGKLEACAAEITNIRKDYANELVAEIKKALQDMNFLDVQFEMNFQKKTHFSEGGIDDVEILISTNPGEPVMSLSKVASGGELSRIMLAIKTVLAQKDHVDTMIFDEIDVGISGRTAQKISEKMGVLAREKQIICITHLPQIAAMADSHFLIEKKTESGETLTDIHELNETDTVHELARLLGGAVITETVLQNAKEMKKLANQVKHGII